MSEEADTKRLAEIRRGAEIGQLFLHGDMRFVLGLLDASQARLAQAEREREEEHEHFLQAFNEGTAISKKLQATEERASALAAKVGFGRSRHNRA